VPSPEGGSALEPTTKEQIMARNKDLAVKAVVELAEEWGPAAAYGIPVAAIADRSGLTEEQIRQPLDFIVRKEGGWLTRPAPKMYAVTGPRPQRFAQRGHIAAGPPSSVPTRVLARAVLGIAQDLGYHNDPAIRDLRAAYNRLNSNGGADRDDA